ncbi:hypothetical protein FRC12_022749, partial [Ceratobasidium sp. 428]
RTTSKEKPVVEPQPHGKDSCFVPHSITLGAQPSESSLCALFTDAFPEPTSLMEHLVSSHSAKALDLPSPSLSSLTVADSSDSTPARKNTELLPFPSPGLDAVPHPFQTLSTPTPNPRAHCLATLTHPLRSSDSGVSSLSKTVLVPHPPTPKPLAVPIQLLLILLPPILTITLQTAPKMSGNKDLCAAQLNVLKLPLFNDDMDPICKVKWRHMFIIAMHDITNKK